jgi:hypothetical protein
MKVKEYLTEATAMKWTDKTPTKKGHYWVRNVDGKTKKFIVYFDGKYVETTLGKMLMKDFLPDKRGFSGTERQWAGPLPEPKD